MYLFFDTETTGIPRNYGAPASDLGNWPRIVQIAWLLTDEKADEVAVAQYIVKPDGFTIPKDAVAIHGITTETALRDGRELKSVLAEVVSSIEGASVLVAHNVEFDGKILGAELLRAGYPNLVESKKQKCTMRESTNYCRLRGGRHGYKWPTLQQLYGILFKETMTGAHRAIDDVRACAKCYFELKRLKVMT